MKDKNQQIWQITQLFLLLATMSIVFTVLKLSSDLIVPLLIAVAISILLSPLFSYLESRHIPKVASLIFLTFLILVPIVALGGYIGGEVQDFSQNYQDMQKEFDGWLLQLSAITGKLGVSIAQEDISKALSSLNVQGLIKNLVLQTKNQFSDIFLIFFVVAFILMESTFLYNKLVKVMSDRGGNIEENMEFIAKIKKYFLLKMKTSSVTALLLLAGLLILDIRYAILWAVLAFFLNFIPVIGSILAAIPAVIMGLIDQGFMIGAWVMLWYIVVNILIGNVLEPRIMGKGLGLSALVIFLSMTFWGWLFGPAGMILSAPLTVGMQYLFSKYDETKWIAFMLSDYQQEPKKS